MKPAPFRLHRPETLGDVHVLLSEHGDDAKVIAGGQSLIPLLALRLTHFDHLIDLNLVEDLAGINVGDDGLTLGALVRQSTAEHSDEVHRLAPLVSRALPEVGHFQIRNRGTIGGNLAHADPASELPAVAMALGASFQIEGAFGTRVVGSEEFFVDRWTTVIRPDELLVAVRFPRWADGSGFALEEANRRHGDFAMAGAACALTCAGGMVDRARVALFGVGQTPVLCAEAGQQMVGRAVEELDGRALHELASIAVEGLEPPDDVHADGAYRRSVAAVLVSRVLGSALREANGV